MIDERMALIELIEKQADSDFVRDMLAFAAHRPSGPRKCLLPGPCLLDVASRLRADFSID